MPAIQPARLKLQVAALSAVFDQPEVFTQQLIDLLEQYADRTQRPGQSGTPNPLLPSFNVPSPVIRQILATIHSNAEEDSQTTLRLSDILWMQPNLECKILSSHLLGWVKSIPTTAIIERISRRIGDTIDDQVIRIIVQHGLAHVRQSDPQAILELAQQWLQSLRLVDQKIGLIALDTLVGDHNFDNLPAIFLMVTPFFRKAPIELRPVLVDFINSLALRSPQETTYLLQENLRATENPDTAWLIRQLLTSTATNTDEFKKVELHEDLKQSLRQALRNNIMPEE